MIKYMVIGVNSMENIDLSKLSNDELLELLSVLEGMNDSIKGDDGNELFSKSD